VCADSAAELPITSSTNTRRKQTYKVSKRGEPKTKEKQVTAVKLN
jgi:hypothetical protein